LNIPTGTVVKLGCGFIFAIHSNYRLHRYYRYSFVLMIYISCFRHNNITLVQIKYMYFSDNVMELNPTF